MLTNALPLLNFVILGGVMLFATKELWSLRTENLD